MSVQENKRFIEIFANNSSGIYHATQRYLLSELENDSIIDTTEKNKIPVDGFGENAQFEEERDLTSQLHNAYDTGPLFKYFQDGSRRTYKIADISYNSRPYPIIAGQIAVGCIERINRHKFSQKDQILKTILSVPSTAGSEDDLEEIRQNIIKKIKLKFGFSIDRIANYNGKPIKENESYENRAIAVIHEDMVDNEKAIVVKLSSLNFLSEEKYLLKDGSLEYSERARGAYTDLSIIRKHYQRVVGVSKQFNPESLAKHRRQRKIAEKIAFLKVFHRTPAFLYQSEHTAKNIYFAVWYLRIRERYARNSSPFDGILKVEKILIGDEKDNGLDTSEVDLISANLIIERNPTTFGKEARWHNHLYPVYVAETFVKSLFHSKEYFLNVI